MRSAVCSAAMFLVWSAPGHAQPPRRIEVIAKRFTYDPDAITLKKGESVVLVLRSIDVTHGLTVPELNIQPTDIKKRKNTEIQVTPQETGHFEGKCSHLCGKGHGSMKIQIDVVP